MSPKTKPELELEKLAQETAKLKRENGPWGKATRIGGLATVLVAVLGMGFTGLQACEASDAAIEAKNAALAATEASKAATQAVEAATKAATVANRSLAEEHKRAKRRAVRDWAFSTMYGFSAPVPPEGAWLASVESKVENGWAEFDKCVGTDEEAMFGCYCDLKLNIWDRQGKCCDDFRTDAAKLKNCALPPAPPPSSATP